MRNNKKPSKISLILAPAQHLPVFSVANLAASTKASSHLKILLSRYAKRGSVIRLKKGWYVAREYLNELVKRGATNGYLEWLAITLAAPSYLSLEYILYERNVLTEMPQSFTAITLKKPAVYRNSLGVFIYHHIKPELFRGFTVKKTGPFYIAKAALAKALFDWLYLRRHALRGATAIAELRLNTIALRQRDWSELRAWCQADSPGMIKIFKLLYDSCR